MVKKNKQQKWETLMRNLKVADIVLIHTNRAFVSNIIQRRTESYWNHSALVFTDGKRLPSGPLIVEAATYGIEIHQLKKYLNRPDKYDIGVMRFEGLTDAQRQELVQSFILKHIDTPYDFSRVALLFSEKFIRPLSRRLYAYLAKRFTHKNLFVCSTFIHTAFDYIAGKKAHADSESTLHHYATPADLVRSKQFTWVHNKHR